MQGATLTFVVPLRISRQQSRNGPECHRRHLFIFSMTIERSAIQ
jgi:hypothetical protein